MTTPSTQLEVAAHWLREAAMNLLATKGDRALRTDLERVADDCAKVAKRESGE